MSKRLIKVGNVACGSEQMFLISGPCVIENEKIMFQSAEHLVRVSEKLRIPLIFKSSYQKDNRSSLKNYKGPGIFKGLELLQKIKNDFGIPVLSDIHYPSQVSEAAEVLDVIQIPAYLCMQTDLVVAAAKTGKVINLKHGQFIAPENMSQPVSKVIDSGNERIIVTERGYTFGYNDLVVDPRSFFLLAKNGFPVVFDITHSIRKYGIPSKDPRGGAKEFLPVLSRAAVAAGIDGLFIEAHPNPDSALCDAASQICVFDIEELLKPLLELHNVTNKYKE